MTWSGKNKRKKGTTNLCNVREGEAHTGKEELGYCCCIMGMQGAVCRVWVRGWGWLTRCWRQGGSLNHRLQWHTPVPTIHSEAEGRSWKKKMCVCANKAWAVGAQHSTKAREATSSGQWGCAWPQLWCCFPTEKPKTSWGKGMQWRCTDPKNGRGGGLCRGRWEHPGWYLASAVLTAGKGREGACRWARPGDDEPHEGWHPQNSS